jgi:hypothetical protein
LQLEHCRCRRGQARIDDDTTRSVIATPPKLLPWLSPAGCPRNNVEYVWKQPLRVSLDTPAHYQKTLVLK